MNMRKIIIYSIMMMVIMGCVQKKSPALSDAMSLDEIEAALAFYPADEYKNQIERFLIFKSLDSLICFSVKHDSVQLNPDWKERLPQLAAFYRRSVDRGLDALENTQVTEGVHVFKFYSSSIILKSKDYTIAIDFAQGPIRNGDEPEKVDAYNTGFYMTPEQRDRLARLVDMSIITHSHSDHADYSLSHRLVERGKKVIGTNQLKTLWPAIAHGIIVPVFDTPQTIEGVQILAQSGFQYSTTYRDEDGVLWGKQSEDKKRDTESIRYLIKFEGKTFLQSGETHDICYDWLQEAYQKGWKIDVLLSTGMYQGGRDVRQFISDYRVNCLELPIHEYELTHSRGGNRMAHYFKFADEVEMRLIKLFWGENIKL